MKKALSLALAALFVVACQQRGDRPGFEEPDTQGLQEPLGQGTDTQNQDAENNAQERFTEVGTVTSASSDELTIRRQSGEEVNIDLKDSTAITMDGRFVQADALPEGAEVRASYTMDGDNRIADSVEVLQAGQEQSPDQDNEQYQQRQPDSQEGFDSAPQQ